MEDEYTLTLRGYRDESVVQAIKLFDSLRGSELDLNDPNNEAIAYMVYNFNHEFINRLSKLTSKGADYFECCDDVIDKGVENIFPAVTPDDEYKNVVLKEATILSRTTGSLPLLGRMYPKMLQDVVTFYDNMSYINSIYPDVCKNAHSISCATSYDEDLNDLYAEVDRDVKYKEEIAEFTEDFYAANGFIVDLLNKSDIDDEDLNKLTAGTIRDFFNGINRIKEDYRVSPVIKNTNSY